MHLNANLKRHTIPVLMLLSILLFVTNTYLPPKRLVLHPQANNQNNLYGFIDPQSGQSSHWINQQAHEWACTYKPEHPFGCGSNISWGRDPGMGVNLNRFNSLELEIDYKGNSERLRVAMRNFNEAYSKFEVPETDKHLSVLIHPNEIQNSLITISLAEFHVSKWWIKDRRMHRRWSSPEINNITTIGVEVVVPSENSITIHRITAFGPWVKPQTLLFGLILTWMLFFLAQGAYQLYIAYTNSQRGRMEIRELLKKHERLEIEKRYLNEIAKIDALTKIYNRDGFLSELKLKAPGKLSPNNNLAILIMDLDFFKSINDNYGHDFGDEVLKAFSQAIKESIRDDDLFARWGGEEFILVCELANQEALRIFAEKLRTTTENIRLQTNSEFSFTLSTGATWFKLSEHFEDAFKRADSALYSAKQHGRNRVEYEL